MMIFALILSCPIKNGIKDILGLPINVEYASNGGKQAIQNTNVERCADVELLETTVLVDNVAFGNALLPAVFIAAMILFLSPPIRQKESTHPRYGKFKFPSSLPIFLQYRRLLI